MPSTSKAINLAKATSASCRNKSWSPTCCTACIHVMLSVAIGITRSVRVDVTTLHLIGVFSMAQPLGHLSNYTTPVDSTYSTGGQSLFDSANVYPRGNCVTPKYVE